ARVPMFGKQPVELGLDPSGAGWLDRFRGDASYRRMFAAAFGDGDTITIDNITKAIACFERTIISARSPNDRYHETRDPAAMSEAAHRGEVLYHSQPFTCFRCHGGFMMSSATTFAGDNGTGMEPRGRGMFKAPTLRNIAVTAPYMHDGTDATLADAIDRHPDIR